jgi:PKHD-type hydroxylase
MKALWQMWPNHLNDETINDIISECGQYPVQDAKLGINNNDADISYRSSQIRWVHGNNPSSRWIKDLIFDFAQTANRNAFGFHIDMINDIQYTEYHGTNEGKYEWHFDTFWDSNNPYDRKISVVIQLTDGFSDYEGGVFQIDPQFPQPDQNLLRTKGTVFVFPSFLSHRVTTVTSGTRKSLVSWVEGPSFR